ncbi:MAG: nickel-binding protein [Aeromicrobium sp.]
MPPFMDVHDELPEGATAADVAAAHQEDLKTQGKHGVNYQSCWVAGTDGKMFCLVEAPDAEAAAIVHKEAHGLSPTTSTRSSRVADSRHALRM